MVKISKTLIGLFALVFALSLAGCGEKQDEPPKGSINSGPPTDVDGNPIPPGEAGMDGPKKGPAGGGGGPG